MKEDNNKILSIYDKDYQDWLVELRTRFKQSQIKAAIKVNSELIHFYWSLGRDIVKMKSETRWGQKFYQSLSKDLKEMLPNCGGMSPSNLGYMKRLYETFPSIDPQVGGELALRVFSIPWGHIKYIIDKCYLNAEKALFYINKTLEHNWSRSMLSNYLDSNLYERSGKAVNNFEVQLPNMDTELSKELIKDPYNFNFLAMENDYTEKELKNALIKNIEHFLLELGTGFAYMGREYRLVVGETEQFIDMLFYNTQVHAYVVIEVKTKKFKPEYVGQLGTYVVAVDHILKTERDEKTIGILVCKDKDSTLARYSLESSSQPLGVSSYELSKLIPENFKSSLPTIEELEGELNKK